MYNQIKGFDTGLNDTLLCYSFSSELDDTTWLLRGGECRIAKLPVYRKATYGTVGINKAHDSLLSDVQKRAEIFANDFLSANQANR